MFEFVIIEKFSFTTCKPYDFKNEIRIFKYVYKTISPVFNTNKHNVYIAEYQYIYIK